MDWETYDYYVVVTDNRSWYPPEYIIALAHRYATDQELNSIDQKEALSYLEGLGYSIEEREPAVKEYFYKEVSEALGKHGNYVAVRNFFLLVNQLIAFTSVEQDDSRFVIFLRKSEDTISARIGRRWSVGLSFGTSVELLLIIPEASVLDLENEQNVVKIDKSGISANTPYTYLYLDPKHSFQLPSKILDAWKEAVLEEFENGYLVNVDSEHHSTLYSIATKNEAQRQFLRELHERTFRSIAYDNRFAVGDLVRFKPSGHSSYAKQHGTAPTIGRIISHKRDGRRRDQFLYDIQYPLTTQDHSQIGKETCKKLDKALSFINPNSMPDKQNFKDLLDQYLDYCKRSAWLSYRERYKFDFAKSLNEQVEFGAQSDAEILQICRDEGVKVNFIKGSGRFSDHFIVLEDIALLKRIWSGEQITASIVSAFSISSAPKFSVWLASLFPDKAFPYGSSDLREAVKIIFPDEQVPAQGYKAFEAAQVLLKKIDEQIQSKREDFSQLLQSAFGRNPQDTDWPWLTQDFVLYVKHKFVDKTKNYWWVNQGDSYKTESQNENIWAPDDSIHHHKRLKELQEGDLIIHYANGAIRATSKVDREFVPKASAKDKSVRGLSVGTRYSVLDEPITLDKLQAVISVNPHVKPATYSPFRKDLGINQGYLFPFTKEGFDVLINPKESTSSNKDMTVSQSPLNVIFYGPAWMWKDF